MGKGNIYGRRDDRFISGKLFIHTSICEHGNRLFVLREKIKFRDYDKDTSAGKEKNNTTTADFCRILKARRPLNQYGVIWCDLIQYCKEISILKY